MQQIKQVDRKECLRKTRFVNNTSSNFRNNKSLLQLTESTSFHSIGLPWAVQIIWLHLDGSNKDWLEETVNLNIVKTHYYLRFYYFHDKYNLDAKRKKNSFSIELACTKFFSRSSSMIEMEAPNSGLKEFCLR